MPQLLGDRKVTRCVAQPVVHRLQRQRRRVAGRVADALPGQRRADRIASRMAYRVLIEGVTTIVRPRRADDAQRGQALVIQVGDALAGDDIVVDGAP